MLPYSNHVQQREVQMDDARVCLGNVWAMEMVDESSCYLPSMKRILDSARHSIPWRYDRSQSCLVDAAQIYSTHYIYKDEVV